MFSREKPVGLGVLATLQLVLAYFFFSSELNVFYPLGRIGYPLAIGVSILMVVSAFGYLHKNYFSGLLGGIALSISLFVLLITSEFLRSSSTPQSTLLHVLNQMVGNDNRAFRSILLTYSVILFFLLWLYYKSLFKKNTEPIQRIWNSKGTRIAILDTTILVMSAVFLFLAYRFYENAEGILKVALGIGGLLGFIGGSVSISDLNYLSSNQEATGASGNLAFFKKYHCPHCFTEISLFTIPAVKGMRYDCPHCARTIVSS